MMSHSQQSCTLQSEADNILIVSKAVKQSCPKCHVPDILSCLSCQCCHATFDCLGNPVSCPFSAVLYQLPCPSNLVYRSPDAAVLSYLSCPGRTVLSVLSRLIC